MPNDGEVQPSRLRGLASGAVSRRGLLRSAVAAGSLHRCHVTDHMMGGMVGYYDVTA